MRLLLLPVPALATAVASQRYVPLWHHETTHAARASFAEARATPAVEAQAGFATVGAQRAEALKAHHERVRGGSGWEITAENEIALKDTRDSQFVGPVKVGTPPVSLDVVYDTGSANLWINGKGCEGPCGELPSYDPSASSSAHDVQDAWQGRITFGTGGLRGRQVADVVAVGDYSVPSQAFNLMEAEEGSIFERLTKFEGIFGLAFHEMSSNGVPTFFENVAASGGLQSRSFSFHFGRAEGAPALFNVGGVDDRLVDGPFHRFPVVQRHFWSIALEGFYIGDQKMFEGKLVIDTGTTYFAMPPTLSKEVLGMLPAVPCGELGDAKLPDWTLRLPCEHLCPPNTTTVDYTFSPSDYMVAVGGDQCEAAVMSVPVPEPYGPALILGQVLMRPLHVHFNLDGEPFVGLAKGKFLQADAVREVLQGGKKPQLLRTVQSHTAPAGAYTNL